MKKPYRLRKIFSTFFLALLLTGLCMFSVQIREAQASDPFSQEETLLLYDAYNYMEYSMIDSGFLYAAGGSQWLLKISLATFTITSVLALNESGFTCLAIMDDALYLGQQISYGVSAIVKVNLTSFTEVGVLELSINAISDIVGLGDYLYAVGRMYQTEVVRIHLSNFTVKDSLTLDASDRWGLSLSALDDGEYGSWLFVTVDDPDSHLQLVRVNLTSFTRKDAIDFGKGSSWCKGLNVIESGHLYCASVTNDYGDKDDLYKIHVQFGLFSWDGTADLDTYGWSMSKGVAENGKLFFATQGAWGSGWIFKFDLATMTEEDSMNIDNANYASSGEVLSCSGGYLYSPMNLAPSQIKKIDETSFTVSDTLTLYKGETVDSIADLYADSDCLYGVTRTAPAKIFRVFLENFTLDKVMAFPSGWNYATSITYYDGFLYVGLDIYPAVIVKIDVADLSISANYSFAEPYGYVHSLRANGHYLYGSVFTYSDFEPSNLFEFDVDTFSVTRFLNDSYFYMNGAEEIRDIIFDGNYLYAFLEVLYSPSVTKISLATFARVATTGLEYGTGINSHRFAFDPDQGFLYFGLSEALIPKVDISILKETDVIYLPQGMVGQDAPTFSCLYAYGDLYIGSESGVGKIDLASFTFNAFINYSTWYPNNLLAYSGEYLYSAYGSAPAKITKFLISSAELMTELNVSISSSPEINAGFTFDSSEETTPKTITAYPSVHYLLADYTVDYLGVNYHFSSWEVNGSATYTTRSLILDITGNTTLTIHYAATEIPFIYVAHATNTTFYFRSDTWTVHSIFGFKLQTENSATAVADSRYDEEVKDVTYGFRVWAVDYWNQTAELTQGDPVALMVVTTNTSEMVTAYWNCSVYSSMIDSLEIKIYQRFNSEPWSLRRILVTKADLLISLPASTWAFHLFISRIEGSTNSTIWHGSATYSSRVELQYYKASPWDVALARLYQTDFLGFLFVPWTYWLGDIIWSLALLFCCVTAILRTGSFKPVLAILWILGGAGSFVWAMIPAAALHIAVLMLALALAVTFFRLIYGQRR